MANKKLKKMNEVLKTVDMPKIEIAGNKRKGYTDDELKQIAEDLRAGKIFTDRNLGSRPEDMRMVFMPLGLMDPDQIKALAASKPYLIFEYIDKAGPRSINGHPIFFSFKSLSKEETEKVSGYMKKIEEAIKGV